jgi:hypothetical protein
MPLPLKKWTGPINYRLQTSKTMSQNNIMLIILGNFLQWQEAGWHTSKVTSFSICFSAYKWILTNTFVHIQGPGQGLTLSNVVLSHAEWHPKLSQSFVPLFILLQPNSLFVTHSCTLTSATHTNFSLSTHCSFSRHLNEKQLHFLQTLLKRLLLTKDDLYKITTCFPPQHWSLCTILFTYYVIYCLSVPLEQKLNWDEIFWFAEFHYCTPGTLSQRWVSRRMD